MRDIKFLRVVIVLAAILTFCQTLLIQHGEAQEVPETTVSIPLTCEAPGVSTAVATGNITFNPDSQILTWAIDFDPPVQEQAVSVNAFLLCLGILGADAQGEELIAGSQLVTEAALQQNCHFPTALLQVGAVQGDSGASLYTSLTCTSVFQLK